MHIFHVQPSDRLQEYLGSGHFGVVYRGLLQYFGSSETKEVAVKTMKNDACEEERIKFLQEAATMGQFNNPYVVKLYGVITSSCPVSQSIHHPCLKFVGYYVFDSI